MQSIAVPILAIFTALVIGGIVIWASTGDITKVIGPQGAFAGLLQGAAGTPQNIVGTLVTSTPYIFGSLAVALAFKCGLFNIGVEGQLAVGATATAFVGYALTGIPFPLHLILAFAAGLLGGMIWGAIPGALKAYRGAHEVIITIMMNYIALLFTQFLLSGPMRDQSPGNVSARTPPILPSAAMPNFFVGTPWEIHWGVPLAFLTAVLVYIFLSRTTWGFELRTVGANPHAARYAGISVPRNLILAMSLSGLLAGAAGAVEVVGVTHRHELGFGVGYGFDSITIALLGRNNPFGVVAAALLVGALKSGATQMQFNTQISGSIISVVQGLILLFVAADVIVRWLYRLKIKSETPTLAPVAATSEAVAGSAAAAIDAPSADSSFDAAATGNTSPTAGLDTRYSEPADVASTGEEERFDVRYPRDDGP